MDTLLKWKLREFLDKNNLTAYQLEKALQGRASRNLAYTWARATAPPKKLDTAVLGKVLEALGELTGKKVQVSDLLEYER
jgi:hypothetical protein